MMKNYQGWEMKSVMGIIWNFKSGTMEVFTKKVNDLVKTWNMWKIGTCGFLGEEHSIWKKYWV